MLRLKTDFQLIDNRNHIRASLRHVAKTPSITWTPELGERIELDDLDGRSIIGLVRKIKGDVVELLVDWTTFHDSSKIQGRHEIRVAYKSNTTLTAVIDESPTTSEYRATTDLISV